MIDLLETLRQAAASGIYDRRICLHPAHRENPGCGNPSCWKYNSESFGDLAPTGWEREDWEALQEGATTIAVYGGSFNPPHRDHGLLLQWLAHSDLDQVFVVPSGGHPIKKTAMAPFPERVAMLQALVKDFDLADRVTVVTVEDELPKPVYTYNLLTHLQGKNPLSHLRFVMGTDILGECDQWYLFDQVISEFNPIIIRRKGEETPQGYTTYEVGSEGLSSTHLRQMISSGGEWESLVTPGVARIIKDNTSGYWNL